MKRPLITLLTFTLCGAVLGGCGELAPADDPAGVLTTYTGTLDNSLDVPIESELRVALVWFDAVETLSGPLNVSQDIPVVPEFPASFQLALDAAPPQAALKTYETLDESAQENWSEGSAVAMGTIVVYDDRNQNGQLDLLEGQDPEPIDWVVGVSEGLVVIFIEGAPPLDPSDPDGLQLGVGYNLIAVSSCEPEEGCLVKTELVDTFELQLTDDPEVQRLMCVNSALGQSGAGYVTDMGTALPDAWPNAEDIECASDGLSYLTESVCVKESDGLCGKVTMTCHSERWHLPEGDAAAGWPCPEG